MRLSKRKFEIQIPSADQVGRLIVFDIAGNKVRLIAAILYNIERNEDEHVSELAEWPVS